MMERVRILLLFLLVSPLWAATYYVGPTGSDSNTTTQAQNSSTPWLTIGHAAGIVNAGDVVIVEDGTYVEAPSFTRGGISGNPVTFKSQNKWGAKIIPNASQISGHGYIDVNISATYVKFQDFEVSDVNNTVHTDAHGIKCQDTATGCTVTGDNVHDVGVTTVACPSGAGIESAANNATISANYVHNISPPRNASFNCNTMQNIYINGGINVLVQNNLIFDGWQAVGIQVDSGSPSANVISNNTVFNVGCDSCGAGSSSGAALVFDCYTGTCSNNKVNNNILTHTGDFCMKTSGLGTWGTGNVYQNNLQYQCNGGNFIAGGSGSLSGTITSDPLFVNYTGTTTGNYHLQSASPAINTATSNGAPTTDYDGVTRPQGAGFDIGAYEYMPALPNPPTGLTAITH